MKLFRTPTFITLSLFLFQKGITQIDVKKGDVATSFDYFDSDFLAKNKIKSVDISFSFKKALKPIVKNNVMQKHYDFDTLGQLLRYYFISNYGTIKEIEWRKYKKNKLYKRYKPESGRIAEYTYLYFEGKESIRTYGISDNMTGNELNIQTSNYQEIDNRYYSYVEDKEKGKKTKETRSFNKVIFLRNYEYFKDSLLVKEETRYRYFRHKNNYSTFKYNTNKVLIEKGFYPSKSHKSAIYKFNYYSNGKIKSIKKYQAQSNQFLENQEFVYSDKTGYLQAIIIDNKITRELKIQKYKYTFL